MKSFLSDLICRLFHKPWRGPFGGYWICSIGHEILCPEFPKAIGERKPLVSKWRTILTEIDASERNRVRARAK